MAKSAFLHLSKKTQVKEYSYEVDGEEYTYQLRMVKTKEMFALQPHIEKLQALSDDWEKAKEDPSRLGEMMGEFLDVLYPIVQSAFVLPKGMEMTEEATDAFFGENLRAYGLEWVFQTLIPRLFYHVTGRDVTEDLKADIETQRASEEKQEAGKKKAPVKSLKKVS